MPMNLRPTLAMTMGLLTALTLACALSLAAVGGRLHHVAADLDRGTQSIRLVDDIEFSLLSHNRATDETARALLVADIESGLRGAAHYVDDPDERARLDRAVNLVGAYFRATSPGPKRDRSLRLADATELGPALGALRDLTNVNVEQANDTWREAAHWKRRTDVLAFGITTMVLLSILVIVLWLRASVLRPIFTIERTIQRFARGESDAHAEEAGASELRAIAHAFNELTAELEQRQRDQLTFLAGVAHDLRNPISALKMAGALLPPDRALPSEDRVRATLARVQRQVDHLDRMTGDFLDAARIEAGVLDLRIEECDARDIVRRVYDLFHATSPLHHMELSILEHPLRICCDAMRLEQVLNNLVSNAIKYSPGGGRVSLALCRSNNEAIFSVSDAGIGMSRENLRRLFAPFRRTGTLRDSVPGVGIGLYVAKRITEGHRGRIEVESVPTCGSTFRVRLPLSSP